MNDSFRIALNGLRAGKQPFSWHAGKEFFANFGNSEVLDADLSVDGTVEKSGDFTGVDLVIAGTVTVPCDRCLEPVTLAVGKTVSLSVKWGDEPSEDAFGEMDEGGREVVYLPLDEAELDMAQVVYDYSLLSLPLLKVHPDGECNPEALKYIAGQAEDLEDVLPGESPVGSKGSNPFEVLKDMLEKDSLN